MGISVTHEHSHTLYSLDKIIDKNLGKPPLTYKEFQKIIEAMEPPSKPVPTLTLQVRTSHDAPLLIKVMTSVEHVLGMRLV